MATQRKTWIRGHMHLPPDVIAWDIDWCDDLNPPSQVTDIMRCQTEANDVKSNHSPIDR